MRAVGVGRQTGLVSGLRALLAGLAYARVLRVLSSLLPLAVATPCLRYVVSQPYDLARSFQDSSPGTPIVVLLSPGVDVVGGRCGGLGSCHAPSMT